MSEESTQRSIEQLKCKVRQQNKAKEKDYYQSQLIANKKEFDFYMQLISLSKKDRFFHTLKKDNKFLGGIIILNLLFFLEIAIVLSGVSILKIVIFIICLSLILLCLGGLFVRGETISSDNQLVYEIDQINKEIVYYDKKIKNTNYELEKINQEMNQYAKEE